jgi:hypothetical protein
MISARPATRPGQSPRSDLRQDGQIRHHTAQFLNAARGIAESADDLIENQKRAAAMRNAAQIHEFVDAPGQRPGTSTARLQDDCGGPQIVYSVAQEVEVQRQDVDMLHSARVQASDILGNGFRQGFVMPSVKIAVDPDDDVTFGDAPGHPQGQHGRLGAAGHEPNALR